MSEKYPGLQVFDNDSWPRVWLYKRHYVIHYTKTGYLYVDDTWSHKSLRDALERINRIAAGKVTP